MAVVGGAGVGDAVGVGVGADVGGKVAVDVGVGGVVLPDGEGVMELLADGVGLGDAVAD